MTKEPQQEVQTSNAEHKIKVMLVHNDPEGILEITRSLRNINVSPKDMLLAERSSEAMRLMEEYRGKIDLLLLNTQIVGRSLKELIKEATSNRHIPYIVTNDAIEIDPNVQLSEEIKKEDFLEHLQRVLREMPFKKVYGVPLEKILVVTSSQKIRDRIHKSLAEEQISDDTIVFMDVNQALNAIVEEADAEKQTNVTENRKRLGLVLLEDGQGAEALAEMIHNDIQIPPFVAVITPTEEIPEHWKNVKLDLGSRLQFVENEGIESDIDEIVMKAKSHINEKTIDTAIKENEKITKEEKLKDNGATAEFIGPEIQCWYEMLKEYPDLRRPDPNVKDFLSRPTLKEKKVALFDVDGTLAEQFVMGRFVRFLASNNNFDRLSDSIAGSSKKRNREGFNTLKRIVDIIEKGKYTGTYSQLITDMNRAYAQMLAGIKVREACCLGYHFSTEDFERYSLKHHTYQYAKPVLELIKHLKIVPSLLTGMPAETIEGYRKGLGIEERCHPLQLETRFVGDEMVYVENVLNNGGLSDAKENTASLIASNKNDILFHMGDQETDIPAMNIAMKGKNKVCGKGFFMMDPNSTDGHNHIADIKRGHVEFYRRGHLLTVDKNLSRFAILNSIIHQLHSMIAIRDQMANTPVNAYEDIRLLLNHLINYPMDIQQFYKDDYDVSGQEENDIP